jgi:outer membrane protein
MKQLPKILLFSALIIFFHQNALAAETLKIGTLNLQKCIDQSNEGKRIYQSLKKKHDAMQKNLDEKQNELVQLQREIEKQSLMLSLDAKEDKQKEFERRRRDLGYLLQDLNEEMNKAEASARQQVLKDIEEIVKKIAQKGDYHLILEKRSGGIMFASDTLDITDEVIKEYNTIKP